MTGSHIGGRRFAGRGRTHINSAPAIGIEENMRRRGSGAIERDMFVNAVTIHARAQKAPVFIISLLAEDSHPQTQQTRPRKVIERYAADHHLHGSASFISS